MKQKELYRLLQIFARGGRSRPTAPDVVPSQGPPMNIRTLAALALCFVPACGGSSDPRALTDEGSKALNSGNYAAAAESYGAALAKLDSADPEWKRAKMGLIQAQARLDAPRAKNEFLEYAKAAPSRVTDSDFNLIASRLGDAGHLAEAVQVLEVGLTAHSESPHLKALMLELGKRAESSGDTGALNSLKGLGYVGGD